ncbi:uncharacterized protein LOC127278906 [Leptopilina boulardi]|uniref:uncharacterized protein LOC127278906 n=1 Tax=Leptopilina boulardi TaxID=63433 RepID=UPI0021F584E2|nr:uncharacterized protein LOC127278906 [Leptopilina boulardi]
MELNPLDKEDGNMVYSIFDENTWYYWVISVGTLLSFVGLIVACICSCRRNDNKSEFLGLPGMVTITHPDSEGFNRLPTTDVSQVIAQDTTDCGKRTTSANRSLPDIPKDKSSSSESRNESTPQDVIYEATETIADNLELYATVQDKERKSERETPSISQQSSQEDPMYSYARLKTPQTNNDEHPYAQVQNIEKTEASQLMRNNASQGVDSTFPTTSVSQSNGNPVAPPRTRRSSSHSSLLSTEIVPDIQAANAISGDVQANQDLPYMTPPLLMPLPHPPQAQHNNLQQHFSGDSQDSKGYTSISVREPLANIIAQTKQRQPSRSLMDSHYATVSDDSDEMYAAIDEQDKVYTSGSETYAQIQPAASEVSRVVQNEPTIFAQLPSRLEELHVSAPQPPSVDSLRHVAHAHSRQASSSSATSSIVNPSSPKPEKRQANSPLPPPPEGLVDVYAQPEKRGKGDDRLRASVCSGKSLEDMYAKVIKRKRETEEMHSDVVVAVNSTVVNADLSVPRRKLSLIEVSRASWSSHESVEIQKREQDNYYLHLTTETNHNFSNTKDESTRIPRLVDVNSSNSNLEGDHGYESVSNSNHKPNPLGHLNLNSNNSDPNYELLIPQYNEVAKNEDYPSTSTRNEETLPIYSLPFKHRQVSDASSEDPGYERVRLPKRVVDVDQDTDSEPNYESMPHEPNYASVCRPGDSDGDPNYESVQHNDPNYESVKYVSMPQNVDPPYEQLNNYAVDHSTSDGYEKVKKKKKIDSDYEKIDPNYNSEQTHNGDTDDDQYVQV